MNQTPEQKLIRDEIQTLSRLLWGSEVHTHGTAHDGMNQTDERELIRDMLRALSRLGRAHTARVDARWLRLCFGRRARTLGIQEPD